MKVESIDIKFYNFSGFTSSAINGLLHIKQLPYLSIVQSKIGTYKIKLNQNSEYFTGEGGFFIAPSHITQTITHFTNRELNSFAARYVFLDVLINKKYRFDEVFDLPVITDKASSAIFNRDFDEYEASDNICDRMCCLYNIIKHLIQISTEKSLYQNSVIHPVVELIKNDYRRNITVSEMADSINMSASNLYTVFKKSTGVSPIKYLNEYRLSVASELLKNTDNSIKNIAEEVGIGDQFYFSRLFKNKYLISPQQYRKMKYY